MDKNQEYNIKKVRYVSHEIKNQLSICDLYTEIIKKYYEKNNIKDPMLLKSIECIKNGLMIAGNCILELKSSDNIELKRYTANELITEAFSLSKVYAVNKNIHFYVENKSNSEILADKNKFICVIINLIKNACEAFDKESEEKKITIITSEENGFVKINISNNAKPINNPDEIFKEGFTTKTTGSGLGLYICKQNIEELCGKFRLLKSDKNSTDFEIMMSII